MVHSWVTVGSAPVSSIHKSAPYKSGRIKTHRAFSTINLKLARSLFFLFAFLLLFSGFTLMHTFASTNEIAPVKAEEIVISVDSGETLWELARTYKSDKMDTREAVHLISKRNGLSSSAVKSGQSIIIPSKILP
ncbi:cell division suppressor protein YneA [Cohnella lupini]|uniref:cell division suppressor protein YneA n=1 Tax=Cohnella lupini TaxID=1294267 RepID=UPI001FE45B71|nr:LysM peptidoglycan-binding domain-containing protein [Cohnella lupini]